MGKKKKKKKGALKNGSMYESSVFGKDSKNTSKWDQNTGLETQKSSIGPSMPRSSMARSLEQG